MNSLDLKILGKHYYKLGLNITCISNYRNQFNLTEKNLLKSPNHEWISMENRRQTVEEFNSYDWEKATGIGTVLGYNNLMALDIDGCIELDFITFLLKKLELDLSYEWITKSGSGAGYHILFYCIDRPENQDYFSYGIPVLGNFLVDNIGINAYYPKPPILDEIYAEGEHVANEFVSDKVISELQLNDLFQKIEFRWTNHLVLPNSTHESGLQYTFLNDLPLSPPIQIKFDKLYQLYNDFCLERSEYSGWPGPFIAREDEKHLLQAQLDYNAKYVPRYLVFDTITNIDSSSNIGKDSEIVQLAWQVVDVFHNIINSGNYILKPDDYSITKECNRKYNITDGLASIIGYDFKDSLEVFLKEISNVTYIVCHNYDLKSKVISYNLEKYGFNSKVFLNKPFFCTKKFADSYLKSNDLLYLKIESIYNKVFKRELAIRHNAYVDSLITKICYNKLKLRYNLDDDKILTGQNTA